jgi:hypothetical protein
MDEVQQALNGRERELQESRDKVLSLHRDVRRFKARCDRAEETRSQAVEKAVARAREHYENAETKRVKRPDGRIEDWVRDLVVELVALDGVPTAKVPQVIDRVRRSFIQKSGDGRDDQGSDDGGNNGDNQTISDRSVRRIMCESYVKAFMYVAKLFGAAPC